MSAAVQPSVPVPFVIWTLQRTGGTNLTQRLVERSGLRGIEHEPFNIGRVHGDITKAWMEGKDDVALTKAMMGVISKRPVIKHCVEMVPWAVTRALADATIQAGYRHLFLFRQEPRDRLLSLHFARNTGVWGPNMKKSELAPGVLVEPVPVAQLLSHERACLDLLTTSWTYLTRHGGQPRALSYEQVYRSSREQAKALLLLVLDDLGLSKNAEDDDDFVDLVLGNGDQGTRDKYAHIEGVDDLTRGLQEAGRFDPKPAVAGMAVTRHTMPEWLLHLHIDTFPMSIQDGQSFEIGGVLVVSSQAPAPLTLHVIQADREFGLDWGIASNKMAKLYRDGINSASARFKSPPIPYRLGATYSLVARSGGVQFDLLDLVFNA